MKKLLYTFVTIFFTAYVPSVAFANCIPGCYPEETRQQCQQRHGCVDRPGVIICHPDGNIQLRQCPAPIKRDRDRGLVPGISPFPGPIPGIGGGEANGSGSVIGQPGGSSCFTVYLIDDLTHPPSIEDLIEDLVRACTVDYVGCSTIDVYVDTTTQGEGAHGLFIGQYRCNRGPA